MLKDECKYHLENIIIPYWNQLIDEENGGYYGYVGFNLEIDKKTVKGVLLHSRILWFYSKAYLTLKNESMLYYAKHAYEFLIKHCIDHDSGGVYLTVEHDGKIKDSQKYTYNQSFAIYGLCAYYEATKDAHVLELALNLYNCIETHTVDEFGYQEAFDKNWVAVTNYELSENGLIADKTMNTLLHLLEAYTELYKVSHNQDVKNKLIKLLKIFRDSVYNSQKKRLEVFFDKKMNSIANLHSYGHDIEATWLLDRACDVIGEQKLTQETFLYTDEIANNILEQIMREKSLPNECFNGEVDETRVWWVQAEAMVGFINKYVKQNQLRYLQAAQQLWQYIQDHIWDKREGGEWFWSVNGNGVPIKDKPVTEPWKCPYHNGRMCFYMIEQDAFKIAKDTTFAAYNQVIKQKNKPSDFYNGIYSKWVNPVLTAEHVPVFWKYDLNPETNPYFMERLGVNAAFNSGAIYLNGKYYLVARVEGNDRKSFFAVAESPNGVDNFVFWNYPVVLPDTVPEETNVYDMRLTAHEDGYIYGVFCSESKDKSSSDLSAAVAQAGIVRTKDLKEWERLPNLTTSSPQQRNVVLHPYFVQGRYAFYTRPQDDFINTGSGGGIGFGLCDDIQNPVVVEESILSCRKYHTITEAKNGAGAVPIKTEKGFIHIAHGVRNTAAGLRYVIYVFATDLEDPFKVIAEPSGYLIAPTGIERVGDVSNVAFTNGAVVNDEDEVYIYYASSDTRLHVATTTIEKLVDYTFNTPQDPLRSPDCVKQRCELIAKNLELMK